MSEEVKVQATEVASETMAAVLPNAGQPVITMKRLLEAGVHFGHQTRRWNPKMKKFIYGSRNGVYIIDLQKTVVKIEEAYLALKKIVADGGKVLFVGTRKQYQEAVQEEALRSGSFYITSRWLGGTLTNFRTIQNRIRFLKDLEKKEEDGSFELLPKKEVALLRKEKDKLARNLDGIKEMRKTPNAIFVIDPRVEHNAVAEAKKLGIPVFGIVDTNADPDELDYIIPANDDAIRSVKLILALMADAIVESKGGQTVVAYMKDEDLGVSNMNEAIRDERLPVKSEDRPYRPRKEYTDHSDKPAYRSPRPRKVETKVEVKVEKVEEKTEKVAPKAE